MKPDSSKMYTYADYNQWDGRWELIHGNEPFSDMRASICRNGTVLCIAFVFSKQRLLRCHCSV